MVVLQCCVWVCCLLACSLGYDFCLRVWVVVMVMLFNVWVEFCFSCGYFVLAGLADFVGFGCCLVWLGCRLLVHACGFAWCACRFGFVWILFALVGLI